jgi:tetratricopeptide (TPR) repeat protein
VPTNTPRIIVPVLALLFCLMAFGLFHSGLHAPWYYDSALLQDHEQVFAGQGLAGVVNLFPQRPIPMASFYLNYLVSGMNPFPYRCLNVVLLALTASGVVALVLLLLDTPVLATRVTASEKTVLAAICGLIFLVHPVQTYLVLYVWQRMALLACCFSIWAFVAYLAARLSRFDHPAVGYVLCFVLFSMAMMSKENAITLPVILVLAEIAFFRPSVRELSIRAAICAGCAVVPVIALSVLERAHGTDAHSAGIVNTLAAYYRESGLTLKQVFITQCRLLFTYVSVILFPAPDKVLLVAPPVIYGSLADSPRSMIAVAAACALPLVALCGLRKRPLSAFGMLFFVINLLPEAFLVPQFLYFVYRASLPMVGIFLIVLDGVLWLLDACERGRSRVWARAAVAGVCAMAIVAAGLTTQSKAELWADPVRVWSEVVDHMPRQGENREKRSTVNAYNNLGIALQKQGSADDATYYHQLAVQANPFNARSRVLLAKAYIREGELAEAYTATKEAIAIAPGYAEAHMGLAIILLQQDRLTEALVPGNRAVDLDPDNARYHHDLGAILLKLGKYQEAAKHFARAVELNPGFVLAYYKLGTALWAEGKPDRAMEQFRKAIELKPDHVRARNDLAAILAQAGHTQEAVDQLRAILDRNPNDAVAKANLAALLRRPNAAEGSGK